MIENILDAGPGRRRAIIEINPDVLRAMFTPGLFIECTKGLPRSANALGIAQDHQRNLILLYVECDEFEMTSSSLELPVFKPEFKSYYGKELGVMRRLIENVKMAAGEVEPPKAPDWSKIGKEAEKRFREHNDLNALGVHDLAPAFIIAVILGACALIIWGPR